jgi:dipeptidyl aminopeptidase/acylaminoacyl peptidase
VGNIWRVPGRGRADEDREAVKLLYSTRDDLTPSVAPGAPKIAFQSHRGGSPNIWTANLDGSDPVQLTQFTKHTGTPRWSPDGRWIVFDSVEAGNWDLYVIDAEGGIPRRLTSSPADDGTGTWSRNGHWIYFHSNRSGSPQIWKIPWEGGEAVQVTRDGGFYAEESWDGESLYFVRSHTGGGIWRLPVAGGEPTEVIDGPVRWGDWSVVPTGIYFGMIESPEREQGDLPLASFGGSGELFTIHFFDFGSGEVTRWFQRQSRYEHTFLAATPDEQWILFTAWAVGEAELMLAENLR